MNSSKENRFTTRDLLVPAGVLLLISGGMILLDQSLQTGWLSYTMVILAGLLILGGGMAVRNPFWALAGGLMAGVAVGSYFLLQALQLVWNVRLGGFLASFGFGWLLVFLLIVLRRQLQTQPLQDERRLPWWMLIPGAVSTALGACFFFSSMRVVDFVLYLGLGLALALLAWGAFEKLFGLIIPGCLVLGASSGVYLAWGWASGISALAQTGVMLVFFGLGWLLITVFSRRITTGVIWWPLIPGGILAVVGWGLYIGGNPNNALNFISNTGSIALMLFGIYLLLLRRGIR